jgi:hypothetical protein
MNLIEKTPSEGTLRSYDLSIAQSYPHDQQTLFSKKAEGMLLQD